MWKKGEEYIHSLFYEGVHTTIILFNFSCSYLNPNYLFQLEAKYQSTEQSGILFAIFYHKCIKRSPICLFGYQPSTFARFYTIYLIMQSVIFFQVWTPKNLSKNLWFYLSLGTHRLRAKSMGKRYCKHHKAIFKHYNVHKDCPADINKKG